MISISLVALPGRLRGLLAHPAEGAVEVLQGAGAGLPHHLQRNT